MSPTPLPSPTTAEVSSHGSREDIRRLTELDDYQTRAMTTNLWPRVFTEYQVRDMLSEVTEDLEQRLGWLDEAIDVDDVLDRNTTSFNRAIYQVLGACEEIGEIAGKFKKTIRDHDGVVSEDRAQAIKSENGDGLWYLSAIAAAFGWQLSDVARDNLLKLADREVRGVLRGEGDTR